jgi:hypothetical protein
VWAPYQPNICSQCLRPVGTKDQVAATPSENSGADVGVVSSPLSGNDFYVSPRVQKVRPAWPMQTRNSPSGACAT